MTGSQLTWAELTMLRPKRTLPDKELQLHAQKKSNFLDITRQSRVIAHQCMASSWQRDQTRTWDARRNLSAHLERHILISHGHALRASEQLSGTTMLSLNVTCRIEITHCPFRRCRYTL